MTYTDFADYLFYEVYVMSQNLSDLILFTGHLIGHLIGRELEEWEKERIEYLLEEPEQVGFSTGVVIVKARQNGRNNAIKNLIEDYYQLGEEFKPEILTYTRRCDCLKCRMGKPDQCTTYSPRKRGRK